MTGSRQRVDVERAVAARPVLGDRPRHGDRLEQREAVVAEVVIVVERPGEPVPVDLLDQPPLARRRPDPDPGGRGSRQALELVAVMVREQDVRDSLDSELVQPVERRAGAEVHENGLAARPEDVDVARVAKHRDPRRDLVGHPVRYHEHARQRAWIAVLRRGWRRWRHAARDRRRARLGPIGHGQP